MEEDPMSAARPFAIPDFTADELFYKRMYEQNPDAHLDWAKPIKEINRLCPALADQIDEGNPYSVRSILHEQNFPRQLDILILPNARYAPAFIHTHSFFEVICVLSGQCENQFSSVTLPMKAGDVCIMAPGTTHALSVFDDDCIVYNLLVRSGTFEQCFLNSLPYDSVLYKFFANALHTLGEESYLYFKKPQDPVLVDLVRRMCSEFLNQKKYYESFLNALLTEFFIHLLRNHEQEVIRPNPTGKKQDSNLLQIMQYIEQHFNTLTLKDLSSAFNYSERHMIRILKNYTGESFSSLIRSARLNRACELLRNTDTIIQQIITEVGYRNSTHFYSSFKDKYDMTPAEYREKFVVSGFFNAEI